MSGLSSKPTKLLMFSIDLPWPKNASDMVSSSNS